jgi:hypothetical protein
MSLDTLMPALGGGVLAGLAQSYVTPWVTSAVGLAPTGLLYRAVQGGVALGGAWALDATGMVPRPWTRAMAGFGLAFAALGVISDLQRGGVGALVPQTGASAAPPAGPVPMLGAYQRALPVGSSYGQASRGLGTYYAALAR